jgi:hypothetical protein
MGFRNAVQSLSIVNESRSNIDEHLILHFALSHPGDIVQIRDTFITEDGLTEIAVKIKSLFPDAQITGIRNTIFAHWNDVLVACSRPREQSVVLLVVCAPPDTVQAIKAKVDAIYQTRSWSSLKLWYVEDDGVSSDHIHLKAFGDYVPEFYPWLEPDYFDRYLESSASILFMAGPPGTGKTSVLRHMLTSHKLHAAATYDEAVLDSDKIFLDFFMSDDLTVLIIEDADNFLTSRSETKNQRISRFLNFSDGLAKAPEKKIVFTTNLGSFDQVDPALTRPGRCFGILHARPLTYREAVKAAEIAKVELPDLHDGITIAELLNPRDARQEVKLRKVGFRA